MLAVSKRYVPTCHKRLPTHFHTLYCSLFAVVSSAILVESGSVELALLNVKSVAEVYLLIGGHCHLRAAEKGHMVP